MHTQKNTLTAFKHHNSQNFPLKKKTRRTFFSATVPWTRRAAPVFSAPQRSVQVVEMRSAMEKNLGKNGLIVAKDLKIYLVKMC
jgi:hypothetical protein